MMEFTGERYIPSVSGQIRYEHMHRYAWCSQFVHGLEVLDLACGSGYGSALLANVSKSVVGIDLSEEAVTYSQSVYGDVENLKFVQGSATAIPMPDHRFDVVVSFETLEHLTDQALMISEIKRVLKPTGFLIISSPNREIYSDKQDQDNPFHEKELSFDEFSKLISNKFAEITYFCQRIARASFIFPKLEAHELSKTGPALESLVDSEPQFERRPPNFIDPVYFVAVAYPAKQRAVELAGSVFSSDDDPLSIELQTLSTAVVTRDGQLRDLYAAINAADERNDALITEVRSLSDAVVSRDERLRDLYAAINAAEERNAALVAEVRGLSDSVVSRDGRLRDLYAAVGAAEERNAALTAEVRSLRDALVTRDTQLRDNLDIAKRTGRTQRDH